MCCTSRRWCAGRLPQRRPCGGPSTNSTRRPWKDSPQRGRLTAAGSGPLVESHSDKQGAAPTYKKHIYGLHPIVVSCANTSEILAVLLRKGNAGSKDLLAWIKTEAAEHGYTWHYSVGFDVTEAVRTAVTTVPTRVWTCALTPEDEIRRGAHVTEITGLLIVAQGWPHDMLFDVSDLEDGGATRCEDRLDLVGYAR